jgi:hypothetical protein
MSLTLRFKKTLDEAATLTLIRSDGSFTRTKIGPADGFGPMHDMAHLVVERQLLLTNGFLGLVAQGVSFADFESDDAGRTEPDAIRADAIAGLLSLEAITGHRLTLAVFNDAVSAKCSEMRPGFRVPDLVPTALNALRSELSALHRQWDSLDPGATLEMRFGAGEPASEALPERPPMIE